MKTPPLQPETTPPDEQAAPRLPACMNCGAELADQYCQACGQRKQRRLVSVMTVFGEFFSELANWDSRLWRTLWPLFFKPGTLTRAYMDGKRARFIPPVRLYLISSVVFFVVISFSPKAFFDDIGEAVDQTMGGLDKPVTSQIDRDVMRSILRDAGVTNIEFEDDETNVDEPQPSPDSAEPDIAELELDGREIRGVDDPPVDPTGNPPPEDEAGPGTADEADGAPVSQDDVPAELAATADPAPAAAEAPADELAQALGDATIITPETVLEFCEQLKVAELGRWGLLRTYFYNTCLSFSTWGGLLQFAQELLDNLPKTLLVLLPLMALFNKFIYLFPMRYYVEHLLFYVHNFSFLFLFSLTLISLSALAGLAGVNIGDILTLVGLLYIVYYFLKSMRVVYGQGRFMTFIKWFMQLTAFAIMTPFVLTLFALATAALHAL